MADFAVGLEKISAQGQSGAKEQISRAVAKKATEVGHLPTIVALRWLKLFNT